MRKIPFVLFSVLFLASCHGESITILESGLSSATITGDYGLDEFLQKGGALNDKAVVRFLMEGAGCLLQKTAGIFLDVILTGTDAMRLFLQPVHLLHMHQSLR